MLKKLFRPKRADLRVDSIHRTPGLVTAYPTTAARRRRDGKFFA